MKDFNFMPSIEMKLIQNTKESRKEIDDDEEIDVFDKPLSGQELTNNQPLINFKKLRKYIHFDINVRTQYRSKNK